MELDPESIGDLTPTEPAKEITWRKGKPSISEKRRANWPRTVRPRVGRPYTRCPICQAQIYPTASKKIATPTQMGFASAVALALHKRSKHSEESQDDDD